MRFYSFFARFWVNYRVFLVGCPLFLTTFVVVKTTLHTVRTYGVVQTRFKVHTNLKLLI